MMLLIILLKDLNDSQKGQKKEIKINNMIEIEKNKIKNEQKNINPLINTKNEYLYEEKEKDSYSSSMNSKANSNQKVAELANQASNISNGNNDCLYEEKDSSSSLKNTKENDINIQKYFELSSQSSKTRKKSDEKGININNNNNNIHYLFMKLNKIIGNHKYK